MLRVSMLLRKRATTLVAAVALLTAGAALAPAGASASSGYVYWQFGLPAHSWCCDTGTFTIFHGDVDYNYVHYDGAGTVSVCERFFDWTINTFIDRKCANQNILSDYRPNWGHDLSGDAANDSDYYHTIYGQITYG